MSKSMELRTYDVSLSEVNETSEGLFVRGIVNRPGTWSNKLPGKNGKPFIERIMPEAFAEALRNNPNIKFLAEHDKNVMLASTKRGSLKLEVAGEGLVMEARIAPSPLGEHIYTLIKTGEMAEMSLGMYVLKDEWDTFGDIAKRTITDLYLTEVSAVTDGAHIQTAIEARSIELVEVEVPNIEERNFENMNEKQLREKQQELLVEVETIDNSIKLEKRSANTDEELRKKVILNELNQIDEQLEAFVEKTKSYVKEERNMENKTNDLQFEKRAVQQFIARNFGGEELRNITSDTNPGQLTIPTQLSDFIVEKLYERAPIFSRTRNFTPVNGFLEILKEGFHGTAAFVGEMAENVTPNDFTMSKVKLDQKRVVSAIQLSQHIINDSGIDVVDYAVKMLTKRIGQTIDANVLRGVKNNGEFEGILTTAITAIDKVEAVSASAITIDELYDLYLSMNPEYLGGAVWVMSRNTFNMIAKLVDSEGKYHLVRDVANNGPVYKLFGQPVLIQEAMPDHEAGAGRTVIFANLGEGYATMTKKGLNFKHIENDTTQALRGSVLLVLDGYMDGKILNEDAIRCLKAPSA
ncbi:phage major capsid protein [Priestia flexa]|uniref:phage major capsid protein n=1 Tax=Priestia flexa TaxID=86664 RepID=UPI00240E1D9B|nr:phage major capsid protein [Priestia flexa]WEZ08139.1 phage major capsid protein [Priestia flexa]